MRAGRKEGGGGGRKKCWMKGCLFFTFITVETPSIPLLVSFLRPCYLFLSGNIFWLFSF